jgi:fatty-acyl-CoA synthase
VAPPCRRSLIEAFEKRFGATIIQGWGMTETSPLAAFGLPPARRLDGHDDMYYKVKAGRVVAGVEVRVVAEDGTILPHDGESVGEFEIRGPWVTGSYYKDEDPAKFHDGWLRTGDVGTLDQQGYMTISDRTKDVIKSGGEWISSVELENAVMAHPDVFEAAVIAVPDPKWSERPLVAVVPKPGRTPPRRIWSSSWPGASPAGGCPTSGPSSTEIPKTSVGKFDKKVMRAAFADGDYKVQTVPLPEVTVLLGTDLLEPLQAGRHGLKHRIGPVDPRPAITQEVSSGKGP